ncbi:MAG: hypothetical protein RIT27_1335 [Pseudomonadota bacterium]|jgi:hypothetical protein
MKLLWILLLWVNFAHAAPLTTQDLPEILKGWVSWVLHDETTRDCPFFYHQEEQVCRWAGRLYLQVDGKQGYFSQDWQTFGETWIDVIGDAQHYPQQITVKKLPDGETKSAIVTDHNGKPRIFIEKSGHYKIEGTWQWERLPEFLPVSQDTGLVNLTLNGETIASPDLDKQGQLWLKRDGTTDENTSEDNRLEMRVFRHLLDEIPAQLTTRLELEISGLAREEIINPLFDPQLWRALSLESSLPTRLETDGRLRIQVRPGHWVINVRARSLEYLNNLKPILLQDEEVWVFEARHDLRQVEIAGITSIDPKQSGLPKEWQSFPAYRLQVGETLQFQEKRRGDPDPTPNRLSLSRSFWLDFDGGGYTLQDQISGTMTNGWRLDMAEPIKLGRVNINAQDQLITRLNDQSPTGVEVRQGNLNLTADSRIDAPLRTLPAVGWLHDIQQLSVNLNLPAGWRLFHVSGADNKPLTWLYRWTLLDVFIVVVIAIIITKLWHFKWGLLAFITLALNYHEPDAPQTIFLYILGAIALLSVLPTEKKITRFIVFSRNVFLLSLVIITAGFSVYQIRAALFPQLARTQMGFLPQTTPSFSTIGGIAAKPQVPMQQMDKGAADEMQKLDIQDAIQNAPQPEAMPPPAPAVSPAPRAKIIEENIADADNESNARSLYSEGKAMVYRKAKKMAKKSSQKQQLVQIDPNAQVQTGPGLPDWQWTQIHLKWNGPVQKDQTIQLYLIPPWGNMMLGFLRAILLGSLTGFLLWVSFGSFKLNLKPPMKTAITGLALLIMMPFSNQDAQANLPPVPLASSEIPETAILEEMKEKLLAAPTCLPNCAGISKMHLIANPQSLRLNLEIHAQDQSVIPLAGALGQWQAQQIWLNDLEIHSVHRDDSGQLWLLVPKGVNRVQLQGVMPSRSTVQIPLPLLPRFVTAELSGWQLEGLHENGVVDAQLQLSREQTDTNAQSLEQGALPPLVQVERTLLLGLEWQVDTRVKRLSPQGSAVVLAIPLLNGESITSDKPHVENGKALINMAADEIETAWTSTLTKQSDITLTAPATQDWFETWRVDTSAIWHLNYEGLTVVHHQNAEGAWLPTWRPWAGDSVTLHLTRPQGVAGQSMTIDQVNLTIKAGQRATDSELNLRIRSSRGGQHSINLPEGAQLQSLRINNQSQPLRADNRTVSLPLTPGMQHVSLVFREHQGLATTLRNSPLDLGVPSVNTTIQVQLPPDRWIWWTSGTLMGPAVLFWGMAFVIIGLSIAIGQTHLTPLKIWEWILLGIITAQMHMMGTLIIAGWLLALAARQKLTVETLNKWAFDFIQIVLVILTISALGTLLSSIEQGLIGKPDMYIIGNGSTDTLLKWYQDRSAAILPNISVISLPIWLYRIIVLIWALWLAFALLRWLKWGWECFSATALWKPLIAPKIKVKSE